MNSIKNLGFMWQFLMVYNMHAFSPAKLVELDQLMGLWHKCCTSQTPSMVYDILPSTTAVFSYAIGSRKLTPNEQFFVGAQTVARLLNQLKIKQGVSFTAANKVYTSTNKTTIVWIETELFLLFLSFLPGVDASHVYVGACFQSYQYPHSEHRFPAPSSKLCQI